MFDDVIKAAAAENLNDELVWYSDLLGQVRDQDILSKRLTEESPSCLPEQVRGSVEAEIKQHLAAEREQAVERLNAGMRTSHK